MHTNKIKTNPIDRAVQVLIYIIVIALCLVILLPCINVVALAFNDGADAARGGIWFWPREFTLDNFKEVFKDGSITTAYGIALRKNGNRYVLKFDGNNTGRICAETAGSSGKNDHYHADYLPCCLAEDVIPTYIQYKNLHLLNSFWVYVVPSLVSVTSDDPNLL